MLIIFMRTLGRLLIGFVCLLAYMRVYGLMQLSPQSPIDQISNYVLGGIIGGIIYNFDLPLWQFLMAIVGWGGLSLLFHYIRDKNLKAKRILDGTPLLLMDDGKIDTEKITMAQITADDLMSRLHQQGIRSIDELKSIWLESNGQLTLVTKEQGDIAYVLVEDGQVNDIEMKRAGKSEQWLQAELDSQEVENIGEIFLAEYYEGVLHIHTYD